MNNKDPEQMLDKIIGEIKTYLGGDVMYIEFDDRAKIKWNKLIEINGEWKTVFLDYDISFVELLVLREPMNIVLKFLDLYNFYKGRNWK